MGQNMRKKKLIEMSEEMLRSTAKKSRKFKLDFLTDEQEQSWDMFNNSDVLFLIGAAGTGKAQSLDCKVYTPTGYKLMRDITIGDYVLTPDGGESKVIGIFPQGTKEMYRISFTDGSSTECCKEHLWEVQVHGRKKKIVDTEFILNNLKSPAGRRKISISTTKCANFSEKPILIKPYLMGLLLGDGSFTSSSLRFTTSDIVLRDSLCKQLDERYICRKLPSHEYDYVIKRDTDSWHKNNYIESLREYNLWGKGSHEKFIPEDYIYNSEETRLSLLQGLMDTAGTVDNRGCHCSLPTSSEKMANNIKELVCSLGGICSIIEKDRYKGEKLLGKKSYICTIRLGDNNNLFRLPRKSSLVSSEGKYAHKRFVEKVEYIGEKEAKCILIDSKDHLYLTDDFIVTHNTHLAVAFALYELLEKGKEKILLSRPVVEAGENLGFLPGDIGEKLHPYMLPLYDALDKMCGRSGDEYRKHVDSRVELAPLAYLRGRTFDNSVCILDEAQNCTKAQLKLFLTRLGMNSKMIITGDPSQSDLGRSPDLLDVISKLNGIEGVNTVMFNEEAIVRHPLVGKILKKLA